MSLQGMLYCDVVEGSFNSQSFYTFIKGLIASNTTNCFPLQNSVIVMDNCHIHKHPDILAAIEQEWVLFIAQQLPLNCNRGMHYVFLPPYSPDLNPIELAFSAIKACVRHWGSHIRDEMTAAMKDPKYCWEVQSLLHKTVFEVTPDDAAAWFHHCRYISWPNDMLIV